MAQNWLNNDNLFIQYGSDKTAVETGGEYRSQGQTRVLEVLIDLTTLTSTAAIQSNTTFFGPGLSNSNTWFIEAVEVDAETAALGGTSFSVGFIQLDRATIPANYSTALVNAMTNAAMTPAGTRLTLTAGSAFAGGLIGSAPAAATGPYYITALAAGTFTTGKVRVRIQYHGIGTITQ